MKSFNIFAVVFFLAGICSVSAQDLIILRDGSMIEAKVTEISPVEIRYKRYENLDGPTIVLPRIDILSIRHENGTYEILNAGTVQESPRVEKPVIQTSKPRTTALDPDIWTIGFNINPAGIFLDGASICLEFGKGNFNMEINIFLPFISIGNDFGFGGLFTFNYFHHTSNGGTYLGMGIGLVGYDYDSHGDWYGGFFMCFSLGINAGYKFVASSGLYFRTGIYLGVGYYMDFYYSYHPSSDYHDEGITVDFKPSLSVGYCF